MCRLATARGLHHLPAMTESMTHAEVDHFPRGVASHEVEEVMCDFASLLSVFAHLDDHELCHAV